MMESPSFKIVNNLIQTMATHLSQTPSLPLPLIAPNLQFDQSTMRFRKNKSDSTAIKLTSGSIRAITRLVEILCIIRDILRKGQIITKRSLYYRMLDYYQRYQMIDDDLQILSCSTGLTREQMNVLSSSRCIAYGNMTISYDSTTVVLPNASPVHLSPFKQLKSATTTCSVILLVEKESIFYEIHQYLQSTSNYDVLLITAKGYPDRTTKVIISHLAQDRFIYYLGDLDVFGFDILLTYSIGNQEIPTILNQIRWIQYPNEAISHCKTPLTKLQLKKYTELLERPYFTCKISQNEEGQSFLNKSIGKLSIWKDKLTELVERGVKMELEQVGKWVGQGWVIKSIQEQRYV